MGRVRIWIHRSAVMPSVAVLVRTGLLGLGVACAGVAGFGLGLACAGNRGWSGSAKPGFADMGKKGLEGDDAVLVAKTEMSWYGLVRFIWRAPRPRARCALIA